jgi:hypothetical protein
MFYRRFGWLEVSLRRRGVLSSVLGGAEGNARGPSLGGRSGSGTVYPKWPI